MDDARTLAMAILSGFADPLLLLPALALGWWVGRRWMLLAGILGLGLLRLANSLGDGEPGSSATIPWLASVLAPALAAGIARLLRRGLRGQAPNTRARTAPRLIVALFGATLGLVLGFGIGLGFSIALFWWAGTAANSSHAYVSALLFILPGMALGFVAGGVIAFLRAGPRRAPPA